MRLSTPILDPERCDRCGRCADSCPQGVIRMAKRWQVSWLHCDACGACVEACPLGAVRVEALSPGPARPQEVLLFYDRSPGNVLLAVQAVARRLAQGDVQTVVVASLTGSTAVLAARGLERIAHRLICVADTPEWRAYGHPYPTLDERNRRELLERGAIVLRDYQSTPDGVPRFDPGTGGDVPLRAVESALFWAGVGVVGGEGLKTAVKSVVLATDYGLLQAGESVVALGGTGGREAAVVMDALGHADIVSGAPGTRLRVREVLCMPG